MLMSYRTIIAGGLAVVFAVALHAQTQTAAQANRATPAEITLTGCVERADQVSEPATLGTTVDSLSFVLIKATKGGAGDAQTAGTTGTTSKTEPENMYRLDADVSTLNPHVGHKVEVTGALDTAATPAANGEPRTAANAPKVRVSRLKMIAETCAR